MPVILVDVHAGSYFAQGNKGSVLIWRYTIYIWFAALNEYALMFAKKECYSTVFILPGLSDPSGGFPP